MGKMVIRRKKNNYNFYSKLVHDKDGVSLSINDQYFECKRVSYGYKFIVRVVVEPMLEREEAIFFEDFYDGLLVLDDIMREMKGMEVTVN